MNRLRCLSRAFAGIGVLLLAASADGQILDVRATETQIVLRLTERSEGVLSLRTASVHETDGAAQSREAVWIGQPDGETISIPRFDGAADRLYQRFLLADEAGQALGSGRYVTDLSELRPHAAPLLRPSSPKGLQCIVDLDDAVELGVKHAAVNVSLGTLYDPAGLSLVRREVDGLPVAVHEGPLAALDATVNRMTDAGIRVTLILLNDLPSPEAQATPLRHPRTVAAPPNGIGAFNLTSEEGVRAFRGIVEILAERYSRADAAHGLVAGYIVGNEVQSHFDWYNLGEAEPEDVIEEYARAIRVADLAVRRFQPDSRVFLSLDHNWTRRQRPESNRSMAGRTLLDGLQRELASNGDVPWGVAFHPYPEDLGDPRTWQDETATLSFKTPRITFRNLEVLTAWLQRPELLFDGAPRRVILSEQGFHCRAGADGEAVQAAAYAYAFERVRRIEGIESFIYHRHVDHPGEGGLRLGLRENVPGTFDRPGRSRRIHDLFRVIDSPEAAGATEFAKAVVGVRDWEELAPRAVNEQN